MFSAKKDDLTIEVGMNEDKVIITMPGMDDIMFFWQSWIIREQKSAEVFLCSQQTDNPCQSLIQYFRSKGWEVKEPKTNPC